MPGQHPGATSACGERLRTTRRGLLAAGAGVGLGLTGLTAACGSEAATEVDVPDLVQPPVPTDAAFARYAEEMRALAERSGDQSFGAIVVHDRRVIGLGPSRVVALRDATAHAELEAIRDASRREGSSDLSGAVLYSTSQPCPMCETAAAYAGIARMVQGTGLTELGAPRIGGC
ncbi:MAG: nucleoside deaminase [Gaiella sp.]